VVIVSRKGSPCPVVSSSSRVNCMEGLIELRCW